MSEVSNGIKKHTLKSHENISLTPDTGLNFLIIIYRMQFVHGILHFLRCWPPT
jgi:hypothetical protein